MCLVCVSARISSARSLNFWMSCSNVASGWFAAYAASVASLSAPRRARTNPPGRRRARLPPDAAGAVVHGDDARQRLLLVRGDDVEERTRLQALGLFFDVVALVLVRRVVHRPEAVHRLGCRDERAAGVVQNRADVRHRGLELHLLVPAQNRRDAKQRRRLLRLRVPVQRARQRPQARLDGVAQRLEHQRVDVLQEVEPLAPNFRGVAREDGPERLLQHILHLRAQIAERLRSLREPSLLRLLELALLVHAFLGERHQALLAHRRALLAHRVHHSLKRPPAP